MYQNRLITTYNEIIMYDLFVKFFVGVLVLLFSTHTFVRLVIKISQSVKISPLVLGTTLVALGTSLPELAVSTVALIKHDIGLAMGNIIGSNIVNIFFVLPAGILIGKLRIGTTKTQRSAFFLLAITIIFLVSQIISFPPLFTGFTLITLALIITVVEYKWAIIGRTHEDLSRFKNHRKKHLSLLSIVAVAISVLGIVLGGILIVSSAESISALTGYSTTIIGLSLTALATSLPELLTTVFSQEENEGKVTTGNIIGSSIYNLLLIGGIITAFSSKNSVYLNDWLWLFLATIFFFFILRRYKGKIVPKWVGLVLLILFLAYIVFLGISKNGVV